jgi:hypothetical protein
VERRLLLGEHAEAALAAGKLPATFPGSEGAHFAAGRYLARCAVLAGAAGKLSEGRREELARDYAGRAVQLLGEAVRKGYKDLQSLKEDPQLEVLRGRADFQGLFNGPGGKVSAKAGSTETPRPK